MERRKKTTAQPKKSAAPDVVLVHGVLCIRLSCVMAGILIS